MEFDIWITDEPEFLEMTRYKFDVLTHPVSMALGTGGKNDSLAQKTVDILALWAIRKLFVACVKVAWWCGVTFVKRRFERRAR